jgi:hypothetical protein
MDSTVLQYKDRLFRDIITPIGRQDIQSTFPTIKEQACALREPFRKEAKHATQLLQELCNETKTFLPKINQPVTLMDLLEFILLLDSDLITKDRMFDLDKLMSFFPDISDKTDDTLTRPYIFEALWKIVFLLEQDGMFSGKTRTFKQKLEHPRPGRDISVPEYMSKKINGGNESGIADLMFTLTKQKKDQKPEHQTRSPCDPDYKIPTGEAILISSKYYQKEKGVNKYDVNELITEAKKEKSGGSGGYKVDEFSIVVLVKDKVAFKKILDATHEKDVANYLVDEHILDVSDLQEALTRLYFYMKDKRVNVSNVHNLSWHTGLSSSKPSILSQLRFHQDYIVTYTDIKINEGASKFIWGAVPRSGKSYMVGGLMAKRLPRYVIMILGAISETKEQFITDVFNKYKELVVYRDHIVDMQVLTHEERVAKISKAGLDKSGHYIFVYSQELLREHIKNYDTYQSKIRRPVSDDDIQATRMQLQLKKLQQKEDLKKLEADIQELDGALLVSLMDPIFKSEPYVFFDEVQQGSGYTNSNNQQDGIMHHLYPKMYVGPTPILILVTATYAKPILKYGEKLNNQPIHLITWSYENNNVRMKQFDAHELSEFIEEDEDRVKKLELLHTLVKKWEERGMTRVKIAQQYKNYPQLVLVSPQDPINFDNPKLIKDDEINVNELFKKNKSGFSESSNVDKLLNYIHAQYNKLYLEYNINFSGSNSADKFHSQLWFLPTTLREKGEDIDEEKEGSSSSFADTAEFLARQICNVTDGRGHYLYEHFNIAIVHRLKSKSKLKSGKPQRLESQPRIFLCNDDNDDNDIKTRLIEVENLSRSENKSLIILTGKRLRLGISLTCVDVAIHLDPISSVDTLYQSMFRVLTERNGKERGYVIDLLPKRAIRFMYQICEYTGNRKVTMDRVKQGLYLFNVNFIRKLALRPDHHGTSMYKELMAAFHLDNPDHFVSYQDTLFKTRIEQIRRHFKKALGELDTDEKQRINTLMKKLIDSNSSKGKGGKGGKGKTIQAGPSKPPGPHYHSDSDEPLENDELNDEDIESLFTKLSFLFSLFALYHPNSTLNDFYREYEEAVNRYTHQQIQSCSEEKDMNTIHACFVNYQMAMRAISLKKGLSEAEKKVESEIKKAMKSHSKKKKDVARKSARKAKQDAVVYSQELFDLEDSRNSIDKQFVNSGDVGREMVEGEEAVAAVAAFAALSSDSDSGWDSDSDSEPDSEPESNSVSDVWAEMKRMSVEKIRNFMKQYANLVKNMYEIIPDMILELFDTTYSHMQHGVVLQKTMAESHLFYERDMEEKHESDRPPASPRSPPPPVLPHKPQASQRIPQSYSKTVPIVPIGTRFTKKDIVVVPGDGDCLFHAAAIGLNTLGISMETGPMLRQRVADYLKEVFKNGLNDAHGNPILYDDGVVRLEDAFTFRQYIENRGQAVGNVEEYLKKHIKDISLSKWGTDIEVWAINRMFPVNIELYSVPSRASIYLDNIAGDMSTSNRMHPTIRIYNPSGNSAHGLHYDALPASLPVDRPPVSLSESSEAFLPEPLIVADPNEYLVYEKDLGLNDQELNVSAALATDSLSPAPVQVELPPASLPSSKNPVVSDDTPVREIICYASGKKGTMTIDDARSYARSASIPFNTKTTKEDLCRALAAKEAFVHGIEKVKIIYHSGKRISRKASHKGIRNHSYKGVRNHSRKRIRNHSRKGVRKDSKHSRKGVRKGSKHSSKGVRKGSKNSRKIKLH